MPEATTSSSLSQHPMHIVMATPELTPVAKVGGIADVVAGLSREINKQGRSTVDVILPKYNHMRYDLIADLQKDYDDLWVPWASGSIHCSIYKGDVNGVRCFFIDAHSDENFFNRGSCYGQKDDAWRFAFFSRAVLEYLLHSGKRPDIIHCHDWQTALLPVMLYEIYQPLGLTPARVALTIHNFKHQGLESSDLLYATGLNRPDLFLNQDKMGDASHPGRLNLLKGGIVYSNFINTVSPNHAWEARNEGQAFGLEATLDEYQQKFGGIINGIDYDYWNPQRDRLLPSNYDDRCLQKKYDNKKALRERFLLADCPNPIIAFIGRLDPQKGIDLVKHAIFCSLKLKAQFVLLGTSPDNTINQSFQALKNELNESQDCHLEISFSEELAHLIYAGSDMIVVPSHYEPCGLTQLIALRYGTVPIVRKVGGLADTVFDKDHSERPEEQRNGYVFNDALPSAMEWALDRAISCYNLFPEDFRQLMINGMRTDLSWKQPTEHYLNIFEYIREK